MVSGPGQNRLASRQASWGMSSQKASSQAASGIWRISGLSWGRPLARKIFRTASGSNPLAPKPYTVSVGMPTRPPDLMITAALSISDGLRSCVSIMCSHLFCQVETVCHTVEIRRVSTLNGQNQFLQLCRGLDDVVGPLRLQFLTGAKAPQYPAPGQSAVFSGTDIHAAVPHKKGVFPGGP